MNQATASRTALGVALMRAIHARADPLPLLDDPWGDRLVPQTAKDEIVELARTVLERKGIVSGTLPDAQTMDLFLRGSPAYATVVTRSRYAEDVLHRAIGNGATQYVLVGAGFDSFALRRTPAHGDVNVFEIDFPATQQLKLARLAECGIPRPKKISYLPADFSRADLTEVLSRTDYRKSERSVFSWLGVAMYLGDETNRLALTDIAKCACSGSDLVFTYLDRRVFEDDNAAGAARFREQQAVVTALGEPFLSGFRPESLRDELRDVGFDLIEDLSDEQVLKRYDPTGKNGLQPLPFSRIAHARVI
jgi:methyltransferase (TIGR00027 family)